MVRPASGRVEVYEVGGGVDGGDEENALDEESAAGTTGRTDGHARGTGRVKGAGLDD